MPKNDLLARYSRYLPLVVACMAFYFSGMAHSASKNYLDALEAEAAAAPAEVSNEPEKAVSAAEAKALINKLPDGLSQHDLEVLLKDGFYGSYMFYSKLNNTQKDTVFKEYQRDPTIKGVRDKIMELLKR